MNENKYLPKVTFEAIPIKDLVSNQEYQRNLSMRHVKNAVAAFDLYQINPVKVSRRDGVNYVFNGQHTMEIVASVSGSRETPVWCMVYDDLAYQHEANIFANQQKYVKALTPYEIFQANIEAGNDKQLLIRDLVESYSLKLMPLGRPGGIYAVSALEFIYDRYGYEVLSRTLRLVVGAWEGSQASLGASMLKGIAIALSVFGTEIRDEVFVDRLSYISEKEVIRTARERRGGAMGFAEAVLVIYNRKLHNPLPIDKLYQKKKEEPNIGGEEKTWESAEKNETNSIEDMQDC